MNTINSNYINRYSNINNIERQKNNNGLSNNNVFSCFTNNLHFEHEKKITAKEAVKLIIEGAYSQIKTTINQIINNPIKSLASAVGTTGLLLGLPFIGIPTAVGGAALALGVAGVSAFNLAKSTYNVVKNTKNEEYNKARKNYKEIGNSGLDLALSLPFIPKSISTIKEFAKYGKIGINFNALKKIANAKGPLEPLQIINEANANLKQSYNYQKVVDRKIKEWNLPKEESKLIRRELLDLNVPEDEIANVIVKKLAKHKGITTTPFIETRQLREGVRGSYTAYSGTLTMPDKTKPPKPFNSEGPRQTPLKPGKLSADGQFYVFEMIDSHTKEISHCKIPRNIMEDFVKLQRDLESLSPQAQDISVIVHEFEHFDQHSKIVRLKGIYDKCTPAAKKLYTRVIEEQGKILPNTELAQEAERYLNVNRSENSNFIKYLQNSLEVGARNAQARAINSEAFQRLDSIFKELPPLEKQNIFETIVPGVIHEEAAKV